MKHRHSNESQEQLLPLNTAYNNLHSVISYSALFFFFSENEYSLKKLVIGEPSRRRLSMRKVQTLDKDSIIQKTCE